jgi:hypothetical protein
VLGAPVAQWPAFKVLGEAEHHAFVFEGRTEILHLAGRKLVANRGKGRMPAVRLLQLEWGLAVAPFVAEEICITIGACVCVCTCAAFDPVQRI